MRKNDFQEIQFDCDSHSVKMALSTYGTYIIKVGMKRKNVLTWCHRNVNETTNFTESKAIYHFLCRVSYGVIEAVYKETTPLSFR